VGDGGSRNQSTFFRAQAQAANSGGSQNGFDGPDFSRSGGSHNCIFDKYVIHIYKKGAKSVLGRDKLHLKTPFAPASPIRYFLGEIQNRASQAPTVPIIIIVTL
jgi:hypothetical protein